MSALIDHPLKTNAIRDQIALLQARRSSLADIPDVLPHECQFRVAQKGEESQVWLQARREPAIELGPRAFHQVSTMMRIPGAFGTRLLLNDPSLLQQVLNRGVSGVPSNETWLLRCEQNGHLRARAALWNNWACFDNLDLLSTLPPAISTNGRYASSVVEDQISDPDNLCVTLLLKPLTPTPKGETYYLSFHMVNSEVGDSRTLIQTALQRTACTNSIIIDTAHAIRFSQYTAGHWIDGLPRRINDLFSSGVADAGGFLQRLEDSRHQKIVGLAATDSPAIPALRAAINRGSRTAHGSAITELVLGRQDVTLHGLVQAISRYANEVPNPQEAVRLRTLAGNAITCPWLFQDLLSRD